MSETPEQIEVAELPELAETAEAGEEQVPVEAADGPREAAIHRIGL